MQKQVMIDCETLDIRPTAVVLSIAAVEFDDELIGRVFHRKIDIQSCLDVGCTVGGNTIAWWFDQSPEAQRIFKSLTLPLAVVLEELSSFSDWSNTTIWAKGSDFDFPVLAHAYRAVGMGVPWQYNTQRDYRTVTKLYPKELCRSCKVEPEVAHDALCDAIAQACTLQNLLNSAATLGWAA